MQSELENSLVHIKEKLRTSDDSLQVTVCDTDKPGVFSGNVVVNAFLYLGVCGNLSR